MMKEGQVKSINARDHVRLRPGMYIGSTGKDGMHNLLIGVMRFLCEENRPNSEIVINLSNEITTLKFKGTALNQLLESDTVKTLNGLTGFGTKINGTNDSFWVVTLFHLSSYLKVGASNGDIAVLNDGEFDFTATNVEQGSWFNIDFKLDDEILETTSFSKAILRTECEKLAALCSNVQLELLDSRDGCNYQERFTMEGELVQLFNNKIEQHDAIYPDAYRVYPNAPNFHVKINEPELSLELVFVPSLYEGTIEKTYYSFLNLTEGGSHVSYFKMRLKKLNKKLNADYDSYNNDLKYYHLMTNIKAKEDFCFVGPTKTRIEDPSLVQIMKRAMDKLEPEIIAYFSDQNSSLSN